MFSRGPHALFDIQPSSSSLTSPEPTYQKSKSKTLLRLDNADVLPNLELDGLKTAKSQNNITGPEIQSPKQTLPEGSQVPPTPNALEMSRPSSRSGEEEAVGLIRTWNSEPMTKWRILCCCMIYFSNGLNDAGMCSGCEACHNTLDMVTSCGGFFCYTR